ncbi:MAG TPA: ABC transporter permease [Caldisericia bacterium]|nr:ABC transporter permease [Caldisericia bacterium]HPB33762.1 ABC transporter permease [Caldisericia bacterium]HQL67058.1 ABC transporter permease [Caldisericia bacterium]HQN48540.1 ABC transporter permease [Caldisericia bacterium]HQP00092.1 ABC transporter permease [Caldisericia bacterium]
MNLEKYAVQQGVYNNVWKNFVKWFNDCLTLGEMEMRRIRHDPTDIFTRAVQPILWLLVFGGTFTRLKTIPTGGVPYITFITPGILSQSVMFIAIFYGLNLIWDKDQGIVQKFMALPVKRSAFVVGRTMGAMVRGFSQAVIVLLVAILIKIQIRWSILSVIGIIITVIIESILFSSFSMILAALMKTRERFMGIGQMITMPLFFTSSAIYPIDIMPEWLQILAIINPLSYVVGILRALLVTGDLTNIFLYLIILVGEVIVAIFIATKLYPRLA